MITHVTDTALWVAVHRGREGLRPDAMYQDPLALRLAGKRGDKIARKMASGAFMSWMMSLRTVAIDNLIADAVDFGVTRVVNLGAGLDTRPYRLTLPKSLTWIEVDFPDMIAYKNEQLSAETPRVTLERVALDLSDRKAAQAFYKKLGESGEPTLVITEGVIPYLENEQVANLADDLHAIPNLTYWIQDFRHGGYRDGVPKMWLWIKMRFAPFRFSVPNWFEFFAGHGWRLKKQHLLGDMARDKGRPMPTIGGIGFLMMVMPKAKLEAYNRSAGFAMLERTGDN